MRGSPDQPGDLPYPPQRSLPSARGWSATASPSQGHTGLGSHSDLYRGHSANAKRIYLSRFPWIPYAKFDRDGGEEGKCTMFNFSLCIIWKDSSQFVIIPVLLHCFPPAEPITPSRLSGIQGPSRKDSLMFLMQHWIRKHLHKWSQGRVNYEQRVGGQLEVERKIQFMLISVKNVL